MNDQMRFARALVPAALAALVLLPQAASSPADNPKLTATVGPGFSISLVDADRARVRRLDPGTYTIQVHDLSTEHNFDLTGPGVELATETGTTSDPVWTVTFVEGRYQYVCDAHPTTMHNDFIVGDAPPPPPPPPPPPLPPPKPQRLVGIVGPGAIIGLKRAAGGKIKAGQTTIVVRDRSAKHNFHLTGRGLNRKTARIGKGTVTWKVRLVAGRRYTYRSDASKSLRRTFVPR
jgi:plastocyanin